ncbi:MAG: type II secretion system F family protein [Vulcanimicrobiota bacterium]
MSERKAQLRRELKASGHQLSTPAAAAAKAPPTIPGGRLVQFFRCLTVMVHSGLPVHKALEFLASSEEPPLGPIIAGVVEQVSQGAAFSRAMAAYPKVFPAMALHMSEIAESSGQMGACLNAISSYLEKNQGMRRRLISALAYPVMLLLLTAFMTTFMLLVVFPQQQQTFQELGADLPGLTRLLMAMMPVLSSPLFVGLCLGAGLLVWLGRSHLAWWWGHHLQLPFDRWILRQPVLGPVLFKAGSGQILQALAFLLEAGCTLEQTSQAAELGMNLELRERYQVFLHDLRQGNKLGEAAAASRCFPDTVVHMFAVAEEQGSLSSLARRAADMYAEEVDWAFMTFASLAEPLALAFMGLVMGTVMMATFLPMLSLIGKL